MTRPCFLVVDREFATSISTRKLVIETAKFNVITAYSGAEAIETLERFPGVDGAVLDAGLRDLSATELVRTLKRMQPNLPIVVIAGTGDEQPAEADYRLPLFDPASLLELLKKMKPRETAAIETQNEALHKIGD